MRFIRLPEVMERVSVSRSAIYKLMDKGDFPKSISLGRKCVVWDEESVINWMAEKSARARDTAA